MGGPAENRKPWTRFYSIMANESGSLCYLAASSGRVFTKAQIFEAVWSMESESCQSSVANKFASGK